VHQFGFYYIDRKAVTDIHTIMIIFIIILTCNIDYIP